MTPEERFWRYVNRSGDCWLWTGGVTRRGSRGYGQFWDAAKVLAHRYSYELAYGAVPEGLDVLHRCDVRRCVRPEHLYVGDDSQNARDRWSRSPDSRALTAEAISTVRAMRASGCTQQAIAEHFGVNQSTISRALNGKRWGWREWAAS